MAHQILSVSLLPQPSKTGWAWGVTANNIRVPQPFMGFYWNMPDDAPCIFSAGDQGKQKRRFQRGSVPPRPVIAWDGYRLRAAAATLRAKHGTKVQTVTRPTKWEDLYKWFDAYDIWWMGAWNLWQLLHLVCDENEDRPTPFARFGWQRSTVFDEVADWAYRWCTHRSNRLKLRSCDPRGDILDVLGSEDRENIHGCGAKALDVLRGALHYWRQQYKPPAPRRDSQPFGVRDTQNRSSCRNEGPGLPWSTHKREAFVACLCQRCMRMSRSVYVAPIDKMDGVGGENIRDFLIRHFGRWGYVEDLEVKLSKAEFWYATIRYASEASARQAVAAARNGQAANTLLPRARIRHPYFSKYYVREYRSPSRDNRSSWFSNKGNFQEGQSWPDQRYQQRSGDLSAMHTTPVRPQRIPSPSAPGNAPSPSATPVPGKERETQCDAKADEGHVAVPDPNGVKGDSALRRITFGDFNSPLPPSGSTHLAAPRPPADTHKDNGNPTSAGVSEVQGHANDTAFDWQINPSSRLNTGDIRLDPDYSATVRHRPQARQRGPWWMGNCPANTGSWDGNQA
ncbi:hypothetical protein C8A03DRAFT_16604, partial [Achaetomium macrosporum]